MKLQRSYISDVQLGKDLVIGIKINGKTLYNKSGPWSTSFTVDGLADRDMPIFNSDFSYDVTRNGYYDDNDLFHGDITISAKVEKSYPDIINFFGTWGNADAITSIDRIDYIDTDYIDYDNIAISFMNCRNATSINISQLEGKVIFAVPSGGVTAYEFGIFANCYALEKLNVKRLDVSGMTDMEAMFKNCKSLRSLDLSNWDVSNVGTMHGMFTDCSSLTSIGDLSNWDTSKIWGRGFNYMFSGCSSLEELDLSSFVINPEELNLPNASLEGMFQNCSSLRKLNLSNLVTTDDISYTYFRNTFSNCNNLRELRLDNCYHRFINDMLISSDGKLPDNIIEGVTKTIYCKKSEAYGVYPNRLPSVWVLSYINDIPDSEERFEPHEFYNNKEITEVTTMVDEYNKYLSYMFNGCSNLVSVNTQGWDTSNVTSTFAMFADCSSLEELDLSNINTANITDMSYMFSGCSSLRTLNLSSWDTSNVTSTFDLFRNCTSLHNLYLNNCNYDTISKIISRLPTDETEVTRTIYCKKSESEDKGLVAPNTWVFSFVSDKSEIPLYEVGHFQHNTEITEVRTMVNESHDNLSYMFFGCTNLVSVNTEDWDTSNVTDMTGMFHSCSSLTTLDLSSFDTSKVTDMTEVFNSCSSLQSLNLSNWDTSKVKEMNYMFQYCMNLVNLDLSSFDMSNVTTTNNMFYYCQALTNLQAPRNISTNISFSSCTNLTHDSLMSIINNLATISGKTLTLGATNLAKLSEEEKAIATNKGWTLQ